MAKKQKINIHDFLMSEGFEKKQWANGCSYYIRGEVTIWENVSRLIEDYECQAFYNYNSAYSGPVNGLHLANADEMLGYFTKQIHQLLSGYGFIRTATNTSAKYTTWLHKATHICVDVYNQLWARRVNVSAPSLENATAMTPQELRDYLAANEALRNWQQAQQAPKQPAPEAVPPRQRLHRALHDVLLAHGFRYSANESDVDHEYMHPALDVQIYFDNGDDTVGALYCEACEVVPDLTGADVEGVLAWVQRTFGAGDANDALGAQPAGEGNAFEADSVLAGTQAWQRYYEAQAAAERCEREEDASAVESNEPTERADTVTLALTAKQCELLGGALQDMLRDAEKQAFEASLRLTIAERHAKEIQALALLVGNMVENI